MSLAVTFLFSDNSPVVYGMKLNAMEVRKAKYYFLAVQIKKLITKLELKDDIQYQLFCAPASVSSSCSLSHSLACT